MATKKEEKPKAAASPAPQEDLELLEAYVQDFWRFLPLAACYVNPVHHILDANAAFLALTRHSTENVVGENLELFFADKPKARVALKQILESERVEKELQLTTKGKKTIPVRVFSRRREDETGEVIGYFVALVDITREKEFRTELEQAVSARTKELEDTRAALLNMLEDTEEARRAAEDDRLRTELIIKNLSDGLLVFGPGLTLELLNPYAEHIFQAQQSELLSKPLEDLRALPNFTEFIALLEKERDQIFRKELTIGGSIVEVTTSPFRQRKENPGLMVMLHDITREREMERTKTEFVSLAAHQLRTPLAAIKWSTQMLLGGDAGELTDEQKTFLDKTYQSTERMINLINDLLNITRIEEGRYLYQPTFQQLSTIVKSMVESYQDLAKQKNVKLEIKLKQKEIPRVLVDEEKIRLAVQNLVENAIHYTSQGGRVTVSVSHDTREVRFQVQDTGMGIPENQKARVFEKFFRASNAKTVDTEGSGLGLYLVNNIVAAHGGKVWFESEEGKGSTFAFTLPVREEITEFLKKF